MLPGKVQLFLRCAEALGFACGHCHSDWNIYLFWCRHRKAVSRVKIFQLHATETAHISLRQNGKCICVVRISRSRFWKQWDLIPQHFHMNLHMMMYFDVLSSILEIGKFFPSGIINILGFRLGSAGAINSCHYSPKAATHPERTSGHGCVPVRLYKNRQL